MGVFQTLSAGKMGQPASVGAMGTDATKSQGSNRTNESVFMTCAMCNKRASVLTAWITFERISKMRGANCAACLTRKWSGAR